MQEPQSGIQALLNLTPDQVKALEAAWSETLKGLTAGRLVSVSLTKATILEDEVARLRRENENLETEHRKLRAELFWLRTEGAPLFNWLDDSMPWGFSNN